MGYIAASRIAEIFDFASARGHRQWHTRVKVTSIG
jgi:ribosomal protein L21